MKKESPHSNHSNPEDRKSEQEKAPSKKVLKVSEMALSVDGQYVGEFGNPSYAEKKDMFEYEPKNGLLISGQRETALLTKDDLIRVSPILGHVTVERLLGGQPGQFSDKEFARKLYEIRDIIKKKIDKVIFLGRLFDIKWNQEDTDFCIRRVVSANPQFSPEELIDKILDELKNACERQHHKDEAKKNELAQALENLKMTGILDIDPRKNRDGIISYFYLYCRLKGIPSNPNSIYNDGFKNFDFLDELMREYEREPDGRFGDSLLLACSQLKHEWDEEQKSEGDKE